MIYSNFTGRVAKKAKLIDGVNGQFLSMDLAVNDYSKGEETTQWVRVQSSDPAHLKLAEYFTKGRILTIQGNVKIDQWEGKDGTPHAQLRVHAKYIDFLNIGKKQEGANAAANAATDSNVPDAPTAMPQRTPMYPMHLQTLRRKRRTTCPSNPLRGDFPNSLLNPNSKRQDEDYRIEQRRCEHRGLERTRPHD